MIKNVWSARTVPASAIFCISPSTRMPTSSAVLSGTRLRFTVPSSTQLLGPNASTMIGQGASLSKEKQFFRIAREISPFHSIGLINSPLGTADGRKPNSVFLQTTITLEHVSHACSCVLEGLFATLRIPSQTPTHKYQSGTVTAVTNHNGLGASASSNLWRRSCAQRT